MDAAAAKGEHRHVGVVDREAKGAHFCVKLGGAGHGEHFVVAQGHEIDPEVFCFGVGDIDEIKAPCAQLVDDPRLKRVEAGDEEFFGERDDKAIHVDKLARDWRGDGLPTPVADPVGHLFGARLFGAFAAVADEDAARFKDHEIAALEVAGGGEFPDWDVVGLVKLDGCDVIGAADLELHVADQGTPRCHGGAVAGEKVAVQDRVGVEVVACDAVFFVDRDHFGVLGHGGLQIEFCPGHMGIGQGAADQGAGLDPPVEFGFAKQHLAQGGVVVVDAPVWIGHDGPLGDV